VQCVVLAGGLGTRMRPWTETLPKALLPVAGSPFVDHQLRLLADRGVTDVVLSIGYRGEMIRDAVGDGGPWGVAVRYVDEGRDLRGTGGALRLALDQGCLAPEFLVTYGDSYLPVAHRPVLRKLRGSAPDPAPDAVMAVHRNRDAWDTSNAHFRDGRVELYDKRADDATRTRIGMEHIDYGLAALRRDVVEREVPPGEVVDLSDLYHRLSVAGRLRGHEVTRRFYEIGSPGGLADLEKYLLRPRVARPARSVN
jgi:NDP-sugar pyrophosphorylase family protein